MEYKPVIELNRKGKFVDVAIENNDRLIAIEVAMTPTHERVNIEKDIDLAQADYVIVACKDAKVLDKVEAVIQNLPEPYSKKSRAILISEVLSKKWTLESFLGVEMSNR
ncbi:MAG: hypothetical protein JEZ02_19945 [Desulfatibacillum sp.]|nr:hypothetical protein [Desulfatibacillum sp.]